MPAGPRLKIVVLDGQDASNIISSRTAAQPVVEVRDEDDRPLSGVTVTFQLPAAGPGGSFPFGHLDQQTVTNVQGQAATNGLVPNTQGGRFQIRVRATLGDSAGSAIIAQQNVDVAPEKKQTSSGWWKYLLVIGAAGGAAAAIALATGSSDTPAAPVPVNSLTIVPGNISVGGPR
jgi:hypothetical protein